MTSPLKALKQLDGRYGLSLFLFFLAPLIPGFTHLHVTVYLNLFYPVNPNLNSYCKGIKLLFGDLGLEALREFGRKNHLPILPQAVFQELYRQHNPDRALKLIARIFFDTCQRVHPQADLFRAALIQHLPQIFSQYPGKQYQAFRSALIQKVASLVEIDQAIPPRLAALNVASDLIIQEIKNGHARDEQIMVAQFEIMAARLKAELAGKGSAATADFGSIMPTKDLPPVLLTDQDLPTLKTIIVSLAQSTAPELADQARHLLLNLPSHEPAKP